jgi:hypothetical protein
MYDLRLAYLDGRTGAAEVTTAADAEQLVLWRLIHGNERWIDNTIKGGWYVEVQPSARATRSRHREGFRPRRLLS